MEPKLILVVDDAEPTLVLLHQVLVHLGHSVVLASNGAEAIRQAQRHRPDLVLLDLDIEGEDPRETLRGLAREGWAATTPVVGLAEGVRAVEAVQPGFAAFVRKPVVLPALIEALRHCLAPAPAAEPLREFVLAEPPH